MVGWTYTSKQNSHLAVLRLHRIGIMQESFLYTGKHHPAAEIEWGDHERERHGRREMNWKPAAGMVPMRVRATGSTGTGLSDAYLTSINCPFCRHAFDMGLRGEYDFLEAVVWLNNCDHIRRIYDNWRRKVGTPLAHMMSPPPIPVHRDGLFDDRYTTLDQLKDRFSKFFTAMGLG